MGTTNTRVWLVKGDEVIARAKDFVGVRDTARDGSHERVRKALRDLIAQVKDDGRHADSRSIPSCVIAAGMITSPLGLREVPHVQSPAGAKELASRIERHRFSDITELPILLVPGVRSGPVRCSAETIEEADVMRGEETLCVGLMRLDLLSPKGTLLNLGSHWKAIHLNTDGKIAKSITSLSGELIHAAQTQTILASAVPHERPLKLDERWLVAGMNEERRSGLPRALFCVRMLEGTSESTPDERFAFLVGAFVASDLDALIKRGMLNSESTVVLSGGEAVALAWQYALAQSSISSKILSAEEVERGFLTGLKQLAEVYQA